MIKTASAERVKKSRIRAIDRGTLYDVPGKMLWLQRRIASGQEGDITDVVICTRDRTGRVGSFCFGSNSAGVAHQMVCTVKNRLEPA